MSGIVIIGAGESGVRAAFAARDAGYTGAITLVGDESAIPYERPPLSKPDASGAVEKPITSQEALLEKGVAYSSGVSANVILRDTRQVVLSDGGSLAYDKLVLATGARPRLLNCSGGESAKVLRTIADARAIYTCADMAKNVVIVGAGLIGLELAAEFANRGLEVTVIEAGLRPLGRNVPELLASKLEARHQEAGVKILYGVEIAACTGNSVELVDGRNLTADLIVAAIGVEPNVDLAVDAGLSVENGIKVNDHLLTDDPHIYAIGDCASVKALDGSYHRYETWQNAQSQGEVAGQNLAGKVTRFDVPVWFWSDQYELGLQGVGNTTGSPSAARQTGQGGELLFFLDKTDALVGAAGLGQGNAIAKDIKIAQRLIGAKLDSTLLADAAYNLKKLLRAT